MGIISQIFLVRQTLESIVFPDGFLTRIFLVKRWKNAIFIISSKIQFLINARDDCMDDQQGAGGATRQVSGQVVKWIWLKFVLQSYKSCYGQAWSGEFAEKWETLKFHGVNDMHRSFCRCCWGWRIILRLCYQKESPIFCVVMSFRWRRDHSVFRRYICMLLCRRFFFVFCTRGTRISGIRHFGRWRRIFFGRRCMRCSRLRCWCISAK